MRDVEDVSIEEYYHMLERHDWFYNYSDDHRVWKAGAAATERLIAIANQKGGRYQSMYSAYKAHIFSGEQWGTEKQAKPEL
jgi:hypothetical protein